MSDRQRHTLDDLLTLMQRLRDPRDGCPWDLKQDYGTITPSTLEEAYEVVDAIERQDYVHLREELGDLLFQVVFYGQLAAEEDRFDMSDIVHDLTAKLIRRHPHVFPDGTLDSRRASGSALGDAEIKASWEAIKQEERVSKGSQGVFDDVPATLPALSRAAKLQKRAAKAGFDWDCHQGVVDKLDEEVAELKMALADDDLTAVADELGDVLFTCVNLSRHLGLDAERLARQAGLKFEQRFTQVAQKMDEARAGGQSSFSQDDLEAYWQAAKQPNK